MEGLYDVVIYSLHAISNHIGKFNYLPTIVKDEFTLRAVCMFVYVDVVCNSQHFFCLVGTLFCLG